MELCECCNTDHIPRLSVQHFFYSDEGKDDKKKNAWHSVEKVFVDLYLSRSTYLSRYIFSVNSCKGMKMSLSNLNAWQTWL